MNSATFKPFAWKLRHWVFLLALIFGSQLLLIYLLSARTHVVQLIQRPPALVQLLTEAADESTLSETFLASDPTLFAMANPHGFSGAAWLKVPERKYDLSERVESLFWLPLDSNQLGNSVVRFVQTNAIAPLAIPENITPKIFGPPILDSLNHAKTNSQLRIEGDLASRKLFDSPQIRSWAHSEILSNTVAQIAVDKRGLVMSVRLLAQSGLPEADHAALDAAREMRFAPSEKPDAAWGNLIFEWHTVPLPPTNSTNGISPLK